MNDIVTADYVPSEDEPFMALVRSVKADPGTTRNAVIDLDLTTMTGEALPVRFMIAGERVGGLGGAAIDATHRGRQGRLRRNGAVAG